MEVLVEVEEVVEVEMVVEVEEANIMRFPSPNSLESGLKNSMWQVVCFYSAEQAMFLKLCESIEMPGRQLNRDLAENKSQLCTSRPVSIQPSLTHSISIVLIVIFLIDCKISRET